MTRVRVAPPDIEEDVTAEQVAAYMLARRWTQYASTPYWRTFTLGLCTVNVPGNYNERNERRLAEAIHVIARAEGRHPSAVLADIVGPARAASVGRACAPHGPWADEFPCGDTLDGCNRDSTARGAGEESE